MGRSRVRKLAAAESGTAGGVMATAVEGRAAGSAIAVETGDGVGRGVGSGSGPGLGAEAAARVAAAVGSESLKAREGDRRSQKRQEK